MCQQKKESVSTEKGEEVNNVGFMTSVINNCGGRHKYS
jgi:hypothetical protein